MTDLRAAVEGLPNEYMGPGRRGVDRAAVLALIPEGAVLVTGEGLARAMREESERLEDWLHYANGNANDSAAAILRHLRETP